MNTKNEVIVHGECFLFQSPIPPAAKPKSLKGPYLIVADSETSGNHHVVDVIEGSTRFFEDEKGVLFMEATEDTQIRCLHADRHDEVKIPAGTYEFGIQQEYDPFAARLQQVRD